MRRVAIVPIGVFGRWMGGGRIAGQRDRIGSIGVVSQVRWREKIVGWMILRDFPSPPHHVDCWGQSLHYSQMPLFSLWKV